MANEVLSIPEESLEEVIRVIRAGLKTEPVSDEVRAYLAEWCDDEEAYLKE